MRTEVSLLLLIVQLSVGSARVIHDDFQDEDHSPCTTYTIVGELYADCSERGLNELPTTLSHDVISLDLSNNNFVSLPNGLEHLNQLKVLDLSGNIMNQPLPPFVQNLTQLRTLNLSNNNYEYWIGSVRSESIKTLDLSRNKINNIDAAAVSAMPNLSYLDLSENKIDDLHIRMFASAHNLETLILSRNFFSELPKFQSSSLRHLYLSSCQISSFKHDSLMGMSSLWVIDLSMNAIEEIPDNLASNTLQELDLSFNEIGSLSDHSFSSLPHLAVLNLRGNGFREVWPTTRFASNPYLREVHVKGNRWSCAGFSVNLLLTYEYLAPRVSDIHSLICYAPSNVTDMSWQQAYIQTWHSETTMETYTIMAVMVGIIIGILITSLVCRGLMAINQPNSTRTGASTTNLNGVATQPRAESVEIRVPLHVEDLPPSYDEAILMPRFNGSFHSLPDFVDEDPATSRQNYRRSRSIGDLTESRPHASDRRSVRRTVEIHIRQTDDEV